MKIVFHVAKIYFTTNLQITQMQYNQFLNRIKYIK